MDEYDRIKQSEALLRRCLDGFSAFIHGRKLKRQQRDRLREDIEQFLDGRRVMAIQTERGPKGIHSCEDPLCAVCGNPLA